MNAVQVKYIRQVFFFLVFALLFPFAFGLATVRFFWCIFFDQDRAWVIAKAFDRLGNSGAGGDGKKTVSRSTAEAELRGEDWACALCKFLSWFDRDHCTKSLGD